MRYCPLAGASEVWGRGDDVVRLLSLGEGKGVIVQEVNGELGGVTYTCS